MSRGDSQTSGQLSCLSIMGTWTLEFSHLLLLTETSRALPAPAPSREWVRTFEGV